MISVDNKSFFFRVFFWLCIVALTPLLIITAQSYHCSRQAVIDRAEAHLVSMLEARKSMFREWLNERKSDIRFMSAIFTINDKSEINSGTADNNVAGSITRLLLNGIKADSPSFETLYFYDKDWKKILESGSDLHSESSLLNSAFVKELQNSGSVIQMGEAHLHPNGKIGAHAGYMVVSPEGQAQGYILINLNLSSSIDPILLDRAGLGKTGKAYLYFSNDRKYYIPSAGQQMSVFDARKEINLQPGNANISEYRDLNGKKVLGIADSIDDLGAYLVVEIEQAEAFNWVRVLGIRAMVTAGLTLLVIIFIALSVSRKLTEPLKKLVSVSTKVASGQHARRLDLIGGTEIREVAQSFNKMLDNLLESHRRVVRMEALAAVGEMSSTIVHELRSPLSSIKINFQAFQSKLQEESSFSELVQITRRQIERLESLLSDLLGYAKPLELKFSPVSIDKLINDVTETVTPELVSSSCQLTVENSFTGSGLIADPEQMRIALSNLVLNAAQVSSAGGTVRILFDHDKSDNRNLEISVADNGSGIPAEKLDKIFQPFFTTRKDGTGLGLAIVKKIVEYHGGEVSVSSSDSSGTVFSIILPGEGSGT